MTKNTTNDIRTSFLEYFTKHSHTELPSSSLVPHNDPTLMFANAGMNQFKDIFTGAQKPSAPRAATAQKCVRAGGKHNDLDNVGYTARHHTFFEMLGNFSFGDYFKEGAIELAWNLITKEWQIPAEKLCVTVYHTDDEAFNLWKKIAGLPDHKIIRIPTNDNFWAMGDTGPCGPCSEIFYDHGDHIPGGPPGSADQDGDRFIEIWNLVFMQYEQVDKDTRIALPKPSIDTGMGLERVAAVMQGEHDNYDIDLFKALINASIEITGKKPATNLAQDHDMVSHRVIADHLRSCSFLLADGVLPSNEGRGYVLRRIMRRAMRHAHQLGCKEPLMHRLVPALVAEMGGQYAELTRAKTLIESALLQEEEQFKRTLERGLKLLDEEREKLPKNTPFPGEIAFKLYDTYGFPTDLTQDILRGYSIAVDTAGFDAAMEKQKDMARAAWKGSGDTAVGKLWFEIKEKTGATKFVGYDQDAATATVLAMVKNGESAAEAQAGDEVFIILDQTPFYGESGGQVGDAGIFSGAAGTIATITDTKKPIEDLIVHQATLNAPLKLGDKVTAHIHNEDREKIRANHSATHILHAALRNILGEHVTQKGSLVDAERLRFDISHAKGLTRAEWQAVEAEVNRIIWQNTPVSCVETTPDEAQKLGAMALFGEKYGDKVRVLSMGAAQGKPYSVELCGGTHVARTGDIGLFKILSESAVAAGVRRIEAVTRDAAFTYLCAQETTVQGLADSLKTPVAELNARVDALIAERKKLEKELADAKRKLALGGGSGEAAKPETIGKVQFLAKIFDDLDPKELRPLAEQFLKPLGDNGVVVVGSRLDGKASLVVAVSKALSGTVSAVDMVKSAVEIVGGKGGGGRPEMAQGGGPDAAQLDAALAAIRGKLAA